MKRYDLTPGSFIELLRLQHYSASCKQGQFSMFDRFKSAIFSFVRSIRRDKMDPSANIAVLPIEPQTVSVYIGTLLALGRAVGTKKLQLWKVTKVQHLKSNIAMRHESMVAWVRSPNCTMSYVIFERAGGEHIPAGLAASPFPSSRNASKSSLSLASETIGSSLHAVDAVIPLGSMKMREGEEVVWTLTFGEHDLPSLYEIAHLAQVVHVANPKYLLFSNNCYHFAATMMLVLAQKYDSHHKTAGSSQDAGKVFGIDLTSQQPNISGLLQKLEEVIQGNVSCANYSPQSITKELQEVVGLEEEVVGLQEEVEQIRREEVVGLQEEVKRLRRELE